MHTQPQLHTHSWRHPYSSHARTAKTISVKQAHVCLAAEQEGLRIGSGVEVTSASHPLHPTPLHFARDFWRLMWICLASIWLLQMPFHAHTWGKNIYFLLFIWLCSLFAWNEIRRGCAHKAKLNKKKNPNWSRRRPGGTSFTWDFICISILFFTS